MWCEVFEGGVHDGTQVDTAEVAGEGAEGVLRVRIVDVEAGLAEHRDFDADRSHFFGGKTLGFVDGPTQIARHIHPQRRAIPHGLLSEVSCWGGPE